jgi:hypothetical protein
VTAQPLPARRKWLASGLGLLAVSAMVAGVLVLTPQSGASQPPAVPTVIEQGEAGAGAEAEAPGVEVGAQPGPVQALGTVQLPGGGTARLVRKEITANAVLPIPRGLGDAAYWGAKLGARGGAALVSGHVNWGGRKGPFDELWSMRPGQDVSIMDSAGGRWIYRVTDAVTLHKDTLPAQAPRLFGQDGPHRLVLVTCGGDYLGGTDGYRDNRVVTATLLVRP